MTTPPFTPTPPAAGGTADAELAGQEQLDAENAAVAGGAPSTLTATDQATLNDDWPKVAAWDVTDAAGRPVNTLDGLADVLGTDRTTAAGMLLSSPMAAAAPPGLTAEANAEVNPAAGQASLVGEFEDEVDTAPADDPDGDELAGDDELDDPEADDEDPDEDEDDEDGDGPAFLKGKEKKGLTAGAFVTLDDGRRGRVELVVSNGGTVPGAEEPLVGTKSDPAARVRVYRQVGTRMLPTGIRVAVKSAQLQHQQPPRPVTTGDVAAQLVLKAAQNPRIDVREGLTPGKALQEVFRRGQESWPGAQMTELDAKSWALGRVDAFVQKASGHDVPHYVGDDDLLR